MSYTKLIINMNLHVCKIICQLIMFIIDLFEILPSTGVIRTMARFDRESIAEYSVTVTASDHGNPIPLASSTQVKILITDENDNNPKFEQDVYSISLLERSPVDSVVLWVQASDRDLGLNAQLDYEFLLNQNSARYFAIAHDTGVYRCYWDYNMFDYIFLIYMYVTSM